MGAGIRFGGICPRQACPANNMRKEEKDMFCTKCGNQIPDGSAVCPICGAQLAAPQPAPQPVPQAAPVAPVAPAQKSKKVGGSKLPIIIGAAAAVVVLVVVLVLLLSGGPKSVVKKYLKLSEDIADAEYESNKEVIDLKNKRTELRALYSAKARKALKLDKDKDEDEVEMTWEITDSETYGDDDKAFKGMVQWLEKDKVANVKKVSKMAIVEVKSFDKNDKKNNEKTTYTYFTLVKISGNWYILEISDDIAAKSDPKIKTIANKWEEKLGTSDK